MKAPEVVTEMYAQYAAGVSLAEIGRKYHSHRASIRELFLRRGLPLKPCSRIGLRDNLTGRVLAMVPKTPEQLEALIAGAKKIAVPTELKLEWRKWSLARRGEFIDRLRSKLNSPHDRPEKPFSDNVEPFDYASERAWQIVDVMNSGRDSRTARVKINLCSQGVIWEGGLWFWARKVGYTKGPWTEADGRPCLHHTIWKATHKREVPEGHVVRFADGNPNNFLPENLILATRNDLARENQSGALFRKSRDRTALLLKRSQQPNSDGLLTLLQNR